MRKVRTIFYAVAIGSAIFAGYLSFQTEARSSRESVLEGGMEGGIAVSDAVDTAKDGGLQVLQFYQDSL